MVWLKWITLEKIDGVLVQFFLTLDNVSANIASSFPKCYKKSDGSQDARSGSPDKPNLPPDQ